MQKKQWFKLGAGAGLVTMLLGALMVVAPVGAGAEDGGGNLDCPAGTTLVAKFNYQGGDGYVEETKLGPVTITSGDANAGTWTSSVAIVAIVVKGGTDAKIVDVASPGLAGSFDGVGLVNGGGKQPGISNLKFCAGQLGNRTGSVTVVKNVTGDVPETWSFDFTTTTGDVTLAGTDVAKSDTEIRTSLAAGSNYTVSEKNEQLSSEYEYVGFTCVRDLNSVRVDRGDASEREANVQVLAGENITCTFTNNFPSDEPDTSLTLSKAVTGASTWSIDLTCTVDVPDEVITAAALAAPSTQRVTNGAPSFECADDAGTYVIEEDLADESPANMEFVSVSCSVPDGEGTTVFAPTPVPQAAGNWTVVVNEGQNVTCTFTNRVPSGGGGGGGGGGSVVIPEPVIDEVERGTLQIVKEVDADAPDAWSVGFDVESNAIRRVTLDQANRISSRDEVPAGSYAITEIAGDNSGLAEATCVDGEGINVLTGERDGRTVTLTVDEGKDVTCTFVNDYPEVLAEVETPTEDAEPKPAVVAPAQTEKVLGVQTVRALPRTGDETGGLAGAGALMLVLGAALVLGSKRQLARR